MDNILGQRVGKEGQAGAGGGWESLGGNQSQATGVARWDETTKDELPPPQAAGRPLAVATAPSGTTALASLFSS